MNVQTAMSAAFERVGMDGSGERLFAAAAKALRGEVQPHRALAPFLAALERDRGALRALALGYLEERAADMRGDELRGGGQNTSARKGQSISAAPAQDDENQSSRDGGPEGFAPEGHVTSAPVACPNEEVGGQGICATYAAGKTMPPPSSPRRTGTPRPLAVMSSVQAVIGRSLFDTHRLRDGRAIGDILWRDLLALAGRDEKEAALLRAIAGHVANAPAAALVREVVSEKVVAAAIAAAEAVS
jgi:hypothetical protein